MSSVQYVSDAEEYDWNVKFIESVKRKPALYNSSTADQKSISLFWNQVYEEMVPSWRDLDSEEKSAMENEMQSKWRNLRNSFKQELKKQMLEKEKPFKRHQNFLYFDHLSFLLPSVKDQAVFHGDDLCEIQGSISESESRTPETDSSSEQPRTMRNLSKTKRKKRLDDNDTFLSIFKKRKKEHLDENKLFLLSMVPLFEKLNDERKLQAKIEFLATLKRLIHNQLCVPQSQEMYPNSRCFPEDILFQQDSSPVHVPSEESE